MIQKFKYVGMMELVDSPDSTKSPELKPVEKASFFF